MLAMLDERQRQQRAKNRALVAVLVGVVALFYVMVLVKVGAF
jgi:hypothetical protein